MRGLCRWEISFLSKKGKWFERRVSGLGYNRHTLRIIHLASPCQQWLRERASMLRYTCTAHLVYGTYVVMIVRSVLETPLPCLIKFTKLQFAAKTSTRAHCEHQMPLLACHRSSVFRRCHSVSAAEMSLYSHYKL